MARVGNRHSPGRYTIGSWKRQEAGAAQHELEQEVISTGRLMVVRCTYAAGADFSYHFHPQEQITIVEDGELEFVIEDEKVTVKAGQMIAIPARVRHRTRVMGSAAAIALNLFMASPSETAPSPVLGTSAAG